MQAIDLISFPYAGGNKYCYGRQMFEFAPSFLNTVSFEYPGRGVRSNESLLTDLSDMVDDIFSHIYPVIVKGRYAIYGHSMGGLIAYLVTRKISQLSLPLPMHLFITGTSGPSDGSRGQKQIYNMDRNAFVAELRKLQGSPPELLENDELLEYFEPILRADFQASETYAYAAGHPIDVPITVVTGTEEDMAYDDVLLWQKETTRDIDFKQFPGGHFFILHHGKRLIELFSKKILLELNKPSSREQNPILP